MITDNIVRALYFPQSLREKGDDGEASDVLEGHFAVFNEWTEIDSYWEGHFLEQIAPGAFDETFKARAEQIRVLYDHGHDPSIGNKPLGTPDVLKEDKVGAWYEVGLFDTPYVNDLKPAMRAKQLGASFRFRVTGEEIVTPKKASDHNPSQLDERTITEVELYEFGPVTFPAYESATAGLRSRTDEFFQMLDDPMFVLRMVDRVGLKTTEQLLALKSAHGHDEQDEQSTHGDDSEPTNYGRLVRAAKMSLERR